MYIILCILFLVIICFAFYDSLTERKYVVTSKKVKCDTKILLLSDLHSTFHGRNQKKLISRIYKIKPDIIALVGDIFDGKKNDRAAICFLENLPENIPAFFVTGNHEHKNGKWRKYCSFVSQKGITVLDGSSAVLDTFNIAISGASDSYRKEFDDPEYDLIDVLENKLSLDSSKFNVLLIHTPYFIDGLKRRDFDLVLSGHTHGGQVRIPFLLNGLFNRAYKKRFGFFPPYCGGMYKHGKLTHIVGRGLTNNPKWMPRVFNRREIVIVNVKAE